MTNRQLQTYRRYQHISQRLLMFVGCWYSSTKSNIFMYCLCSLGMFVVTMSMIFTLNMLYYYRHKMSIMVKGIGWLVTGVIVMLKMCCFVLNREKIIEVQQTLHNLFEEELTHSEEVRAVILSPLYKFNILSYTYDIFVIMLTVSFFAPKFTSIIRQIANHQIPTNYGMPYHGKFLWTIPEGFWYNMHFVYNMFLGWFLMSVSIGIDTAFGLYAYQISSILRAMTFKLMSPSLPKKRLLYLLRTCLEKHRQLLRCLQCLECIYGPVIFCKFFTSSILMCALVFDALPFTGYGFFNFMVFWSYITSKFLQTFMYAWYGSAITYESENFRYGIYSSKWPDASVKRNLRSRIILMMMQKPMIMVAMKMFTVSMEMFVNIMNATVSYFFLLQTLQAQG